MKKIIIAFSAGFLLLGSLAFAPNNYFEISKNLDIFVTLYKELNTYYVDVLKPEKLMQSGITEMLQSLDPYTDFIPEEDMEDYRMQTTGKYGGIGAIIGTRDEWVIISDPYEGFPAAKAGLRAGDKVIEVAGKSTKKYRTDEVSALLKGKPGTEVIVKIMRPTVSGVEQEMTIKLIREEIKIKNVPYYGMLENNIGYIRLSNFTDRAGAEVKAALQLLEQKNKLKGIVLDLRGNPGGLLNEAINVANVFVDKNLEIVSTRGKTSDWNKPFYSTNDIVDGKTPVVVLADGGSASASEIVAGSLQDFDRAVIIGQKTFGKGLVQSTRALPYGAKLKITTAKYYIPSGRCIQAINYAEKNEDGSVKKIPDSLKVAFKTVKSGRVVYDGGGIDPDIAIEPEKLSALTFSLLSKNLIFDYATVYRVKNPQIGNAKNFVLSDVDYNDFVQWLSKKEYDYTTRSEKTLEAVKAAAEKDNYFEQIKPEYEALKKGLMHDKQNDLMKEKEQIKSLLEEEIAARYYYNTGRIEASLKSDREIKKAIEVLSDESQVKTILAKKQ